jgi:hypothetical protein
VGRNRSETTRPRRGVRAVLAPLRGRPFVPTYITPRPARRAPFVRPARLRLYRSGAEAREGLPINSPAF